MPLETIEDVESFITELTGAQSMLWASILRSLMESKALSEDHLREALEATELAALNRRTSETPALVGLVGLLRRDLGWS